MAERLTDDDLAAIRERYAGTSSHAVHALLAHIDTLEAERAEMTRALEICRGERFGTDPAAWAQSLPVQETDR